jgi:hypothetical protein
MSRKFSIFACAFALVSLATIACSDGTPTVPTPPAPTGPSTLKANAPTPVSPVNDQMVQGQRPTLQVQSASGDFVPQTYAYNFEVQNSSGSVLRSETVPSPSWTYPEDLELNTQFQWRARAVLDGAPGPWSDVQRFRTFSLPGCINGRLLDMRAYFFFIINRREGDPARHDWEDVMRRSGIPAGPVAGQRFPPNAPFYGLSQQISSSGDLRGRVFLPTETPNPFGYFIQDVDFLSDPSGTRWAWSPHGSPPYAPRACP